MPMSDFSENGLVNVACSPTPSQAFLGGVIIPSLDTLIKIVKTIQSNFTGIWQDFTRSELQDFVNSHSATIRAFYNQPTSPVPDITIPTVKGVGIRIMGASYEFPHIASSIPIEEAFRLLDSANKVVSVLIARDDPKSHDLLPNLYTQQDRHLDVITEQSDDRLHSVINPNDAQTEVLAREVYKNKFDIKKTQSNVLGDTTVYRQALAHKKEYQRLTEQTDRLITQLSHHGHHLNRDDLVYYGMILTKTAKCFEVYGTCLNLVQRLEHTFTRGLDLMVAMDKTA